jgi:hypothetical protein
MAVVAQALLLSDEGGPISDDDRQLFVVACRRWSEQSRVVTRVHVYYLTPYNNDKSTKGTQTELENTKICILYFPHFLKPSH